MKAFVILVLTLILTSCTFTTSRVVRVEHVVRHEEAPACGCRYPRRSGVHAHKHRHRHGHEHRHRHRHKGKRYRVVWRLR